VEKREGAGRVFMLFPDLWTVHSAASVETLVVVEAILVGVALATVHAAVGLLPRVRP